MRVEVLVSTMYQMEADYSLLNRMSINSDAVVINQCNRNSKETITFRGNKIVWINTTERGLSKSRNLAIKNASADYCIIADDDEVFVDDYCQIVMNAFDMHPERAILRFKVQGIEKEFKNYPDSEFKMGWLKSMKISSVEMAFRRDVIINHELKFDSLIGAGTDFLMGEENAFAWNCLRHRLSIYYIPLVIAQLHVGDSSWFCGFNESYYYGRGAAFTAMSKLLSLLLIMQFAIRHRRKSEINTLDSIKWMLRGRKDYLRKV